MQGALGHSCLPPRERFRLRDAKPHLNRSGPGNGSHREFDFHSRSRPFDHGIVLLNDQVFPSPRNHLHVGDVSSSPARPEAERNSAESVKSHLGLDVCSGPPPPVGGKNRSARDLFSEFQQSIPGDRTAPEPKRNRSYVLLKQRLDPGTEVRCRLPDRLPVRGRRNRKKRIVDRKGEIAVAGDFAGKRPAKLRLQIFF